MKNLEFCLKLPYKEEKGRVKMKEEFALIGWAVATVSRFVFAILLVVGTILLFSFWVLFSKQFDTPNFPWGVFVVVLPFILLLAGYYYPTIKEKIRERKHQKWLAQFK